VIVPSSGAVYSIDVACRIGLVSRDGAREGFIYIEDVSMRADALVESGVLDRDSANYVAALEWSRNPQRHATIAVTHTAPAPKAPPPSAAEQQFVDALGVFLTSDMGTEAREQFICAFREAAQSATSRGR
jgi:hypothetical protein